MKYFIIILMLLFSSSGYANCTDILVDKYVPRVKTQTTFLCKDFFVVIYDVQGKRPIVTIEKITAETIKNSILPRLGTFKPDPAVPTEQQLELKYLIGTQFDRGHLVPYEDMSFDRIAAFNTMFLTNIVPQYYDHNRGIWKALESRVRKMALTKDLVIFTGPVYQIPPKKLPDNTPIPSHLFKIAVSAATNESYCYLIPNEANIDTSNLGKYTCKINDIIRKTPIVRLIPLNIKLIEKSGL